MSLPEAAHRVLLAAVALAAALALSACANGGATPPASENPPVTTPDAPGGADANPSATSGGTATVVVDGVSYGFGSENDTACMDQNGLLAITLPLVSRNGEPADASAGHLEVLLPTPATRAEGRDDSSVRIRLPEAEGASYSASTIVGYGEPEPVTLDLDGQSVSGIQILHSAGGHPSIEARIDAVCFSVSTS